MSVGKAQLTFSPQYPMGRVVVTAIQSRRAARLVRCFCAGSNARMDFANPCHPFLRCADPLLLSAHRGMTEPCPRCSVVFPEMGFRPGHAHEQNRSLTSKRHDRKRKTPNSGLRERRHPRDTHRVEAPRSSDPALNTYPPRQAMLISFLEGVRLFPGRDPRDDGQLATRVRHVVRRDVSPRRRHGCHRGAPG